MSIERFAKYSKSDHNRLMSTVSALARVDVEKIEGVFVECGVWRGGHGMLARYYSPERECWLYDTFTGMTEPGPYDTQRNGFHPLQKYNDKVKAGQKWMDASLVEVQTNFKTVGLYDESMIKFIVGDVRRTLTDENNLPEKIAILRLDTDFYDSTKIEMEVLYPRLQPGGILLVDDYGHWNGARKAVQDYLGMMSAFLKPIDYTCSWMVKEK